MPLTLRYPDGSGLRLPPGPALPAFRARCARLARPALGERFGLLRWRAHGAAGFRCPTAA
jgi:hypothetical protein